MIVSKEVDTLIEKLISKEHEILNNLNTNSINNDELYRLLSISILCLLYGDKESYSYFMAILLQSKNKIPFGYTIQYSYLQLILLIKIGSIKFNDFSTLSKQLDSILLNTVSQFFNSNLKENKTVILDASKGILPYLSYLLEIKAEDDSWCSLFANYLKSLHIDNLYSNPANFDSDKYEIFPNGYLDLSRAHGLTGMISVLSKIKSSNKNAFIPDTLLVDLAEILDIAYVEKNNISLWSPYLIRNNTNKYINTSNFEILLTQRYCWCSGSLGMNKSIASFSKSFHLIDLETKCKKVNNIDYNNFSLVSDNYFMCHGYASIYLNLFNIHSPAAIKAQDQLKRKLIDYILKVKFINISDFFIIDGPISVLFALLIKNPNNKIISSYLDILFMRD